jgi:hypothetical protein
MQLHFDYQLSNGSERVAEAHKRHATILCWWGYAGMLALPGFRLRHKVLYQSVPTAAVGGGKLYESTSSWTKDAVFVDFG